MAGQMAAKETVIVRHNQMPLICSGVIEGSSKGGLVLNTVSIALFPGSDGVFLVTVVDLCNHEYAEEHRAMAESTFASRRRRAQWLQPEPLERRPISDQK